MPGVPDSDPAKSFIDSISAPIQVPHPKFAMGPFAVRAHHAKKKLLISISTSGLKSTSTDKATLRRRAKYFKVQDSHVDGRRPAQR